MLYYIFILFAFFININNIVIPGNLSGIEETKLISKKKSYENNKNNIIFILTFNKKISKLEKEKIKIKPDVDKKNFEFTLNNEKIKIVIIKKNLKEKIEIDFDDSIIDENNKIVKNITIKIS